MQYIRVDNAARKLESGDKHKTVEVHSIQNYSVVPRDPEVKNAPGFRQAASHCLICDSGASVSLWCRGWTLVTEKGEEWQGSYVESYVSLEDLGTPGKFLRQELSPW